MPVTAQEVLDCTFLRDCSGEEACIETNENFSITVRELGATVTAMGVSFNMPGNGADPDGNRSFMAPLTPEGAPTMLTLFANGSVILSAHLPAYFPTATTAYGICQASDAPPADPAPVDSMTSTHTDHDHPQDEASQDQEGAHQ